MGEDEKTAIRFKERHNLTYPVLADKEGKIYPGLMLQRGVPYNVIIDRNGIVRYSKPGFSPSALTDAVKQLLTNGSPRP